MYLPREHRELVARISIARWENIYFSCNISSVHLWKWILSHFTTSHPFIFNSCCIGCQTNGIIKKLIQNIEKNFFNETYFFDEICFKNWKIYALIRAWEIFDDFLILYHTSSNLTMDNIKNSTFYWKIKITFISKTKLFLSIKNFCSMFSINFLLVSLFDCIYTHPLYKNYLSYTYDLNVYCWIKFVNIFSNIFCYCFQI